MLTRTLKRAREAENRCLATRDCEYYQAHEGGLCSEHAGKMRAGGNTAAERADVLTSLALQQLGASRDTLGMMASTLLLAVECSSSSPTMLYAMLRNQWLELRESLGAPRYISSQDALAVIRAVNAKVGDVWANHEFQRTIHSLVLSMSYDPWRLNRDAAPEVNSDALCYYGHMGVAPHSMPEVLELLTHIRRFV